MTYFLVKTVATTFRGWTNLILECTGGIRFLHYRGTAAWVPCHGSVLLWGPCTLHVLLRFGAGVLWEPFAGAGAAPPALTQAAGHEQVQSISRCLETSLSMLTTCMDPRLKITWQVQKALKENLLSINSMLVHLILFAPAYHHATQGCQAKTNAYFHNRQK